MWDVLLLVETHLGVELIDDIFDLLSVLLTEDTNVVPECAPVVTVDVVCQLDEGIHEVLGDFGSVEGVHVLRELGVVAVGMIIDELTVDHICLAVDVAEVFRDGLLQLCDDVYFWIAELQVVDAALETGFDLLDTVWDITGPLVPDSGVAVLVGYQLLEGGVEQ